MTRGESQFNCRGSVFFLSLCLSLTLVFSRVVLVLSVVKTTKYFLRIKQLVLTSIKFIAYVHLNKQLIKWINITYQLEQLSQLISSPNRNIYLKIRYQINWKKNILIRNELTKWSSRSQSNVHYQLTLRWLQKAKSLRLKQSNDFTHLGCFGTLFQVRLEP